MTHSKIELHLASSSAIKKVAVERAFSKTFTDFGLALTLHNVGSGVSEQPVEDDTVHGASNRIAVLEKEIIDKTQAILVSIENGIRFDKEKKTYVDFVHVIVKKGELVLRCSKDCCDIPAAVIDKMKKNADGSYAETWGETAVRLALALDSKDPHKEAVFGGAPRAAHLAKALALVMKRLKVKLLAADWDVGQVVTFKRQFDFTRSDSKERYQKMGITFEESTQQIARKSVNLYGQGVPALAFRLAKKAVAANSFKLFATGDPFAIISPGVAIDGMDVCIHVGFSHPSYTPEMLILEALQLSRCSVRHGAASITIALPERFHPAAHYNNFNTLLMKLLGASGVSRVYFYADNFNGVLAKHSAHETFSHALAKRDLPAALFFSDATLDTRVMHCMQRAEFKSVWQKFAPKNTDELSLLFRYAPTPQVTIPAVKDKPHIIISCLANRPLAINIAASLQRQGELVQMYPIEGQGIDAKIPMSAILAGAIVTVVQSTRPSPDNIEAVVAYEKNGAATFLFEALAIVAEARARGATSINLINPYQFNARSDKAEDNANGLTGAYVQLNAQLLAATGVSRVITAECHDTHTLSGSYTGKTIRARAVAALSVIAATLASKRLNSSWLSMQGKLRLVSPDIGAVKRTRDLSLQLQAMFGDDFCSEAVSGEKQRDTHTDSDATLRRLDSGSRGINPNDTYLVTDDETATGSTLCQAVIKLSLSGAREILVIVAHNNMPLNWLERQLCLARFLYLGVSELHFSDTNEMGTISTSFDGLIASHSEKTGLDREAVAKQIDAWFKKNVVAKFKEVSAGDVDEAFERFKSTFCQLASKVTVHSLADEFASCVKTTLAHTHRFASTKSRSPVATFFNSTVERPVAAAEIAATSGCGGQNASV